MSNTNDAKRALRRAMRTVRREASADPSRSVAIVARLAAVPGVLAAATVMVFEAVPGEPDLGPFVASCSARGIDVVMPGPDPRASFPVEPEVVDVVIVPGLAFTRSGRRLGQGGGWYDRFLAGVRPDCVTIGACFDEQVVDDLPVEPHDVGVGWLVTPTTTIDSAFQP